MRKLMVTLSALALGVAALLTLSCGSSANSDPNHVLQSITLNPATADAQDYPNGQVQFTATGYYNSAPNPVTPLTAAWGTCYQSAPTSEVTVSSAGVAQCASGAAGTYTVFADDVSGSGANCTAITACGGGCQISGSAQLTCP